MLTHSEINRRSFTETAVMLLFVQLVLSVGSPATPSGEGRPLHQMNYQSNDVTVQDFFLSDVIF